MIQNIDDDAWMLREPLKPAINATVAHNLTCDALVLPRHLNNLNQFLELYPDLTVAVNHSAKPDIRNQKFEPWTSQIANVEQHLNVFCKLSGLVTEAQEGWTHKDLEPFVSHVRQVFGQNRIFFGSDWRVVILS